PNTPEVIEREARTLAPTEQRGTERGLRGVAARDAKRREDRDVCRGVREEGAGKDRGPIAEPQQDQSGNREAGRRPDGRDRRADRRVAQAELRDGEVDRDESDASPQPAEVFQAEPSYRPAAGPAAQPTVARPPAASAP